MNVKFAELNIIILYSTDSDARDTEPSENLLDLYSYKLSQLREITGKVYNTDDVKRLSLKLSKANRAMLTVIMNLIY